MLRQGRVAGRPKWWRSDEPRGGVAGASAARRAPAAWRRSTSRGAQTAARETRCGGRFHVRALIKNTLTIRHASRRSAPISAIRVGDRHLTEFGNVAGLAESTARDAPSDDRMTSPHRILRFILANHSRSSTRRPGGSPAAIPRLASGLANTLPKMGLACSPTGAGLAPTASSCRRGRWQVSIRPVVRVDQGPQSRQHRCAAGRWLAARDRYQCASRLRQPTPSKSLKPPKDSLGAAAFISGF
jgi:hypothetical protein